MEEIAEEKQKIVKEREKIYYNAKQETKRIVADKLSEAEEIVSDLKRILKTANLESKEIFRASELKNRLENSRYLNPADENMPVELKKADVSEIKSGRKVYVKSLDAYAKVVSVKPQKNEAEVLIGDIKSKVKLSDLYNSEKETETKCVRVSSNARDIAPKTELNVIGKTELEATEEVAAFIDQAVVNGLSEIKIIHGVGAGVLLKSVREYLKRDKNVKEFRRGVYGEGENGITIVQLK